MSSATAGLALDPVLKRIDENLTDSLKRVFELVRIPSISTDPGYAADCRKAAEWLVAQLKGIGFDASVRDTPGHPMVVAHHEGAAADAPHVLFYGHYDVQPVDPIELWDTEPFQPAIKTGPDGAKIITGRGTADDTGHGSGRSKVVARKISQSACACCGNGGKGILSDLNGRWSFL